MEIDRTRYRGRPTEPREEREEHCYDLLDRLGIAYFRVDHEHADTIDRALAASLRFTYYCC